MVFFVLITIFMASAICGMLKERLPDWLRQYHGHHFPVRGPRCYRCGVSEEIHKP